MAGNGDSEIVRRACASDGTHGFRQPDASSDFGVGDSLPDGNLLELLPHTPLERRTAEVERKIQPTSGCVHEGDDARDQGLVVAIGSNETRVRKAILQIADEFGWIIAEKD
jgi:hypothetical protein